MSSHGDGKKLEFITMFKGQHVTKDRGFEAC